MNRTNQTNQIISCEYYHTAALTSEGKVVCWGNNDEGECNVPEGLVASININNLQLW